jgi:hypothetical protein
MLAMTRKFAIVGAAAGLCVGAAGLFILSGGPPRLDSKARKQWKEKAIAEIAEQTKDTAPILRKIGSMKTKPSVESEWDGWISQDLIVMKNGEWMAYRNVCAKEEGRIPDLFLGRGSDGHWYYSTYHFCIGMLVLKDMMDQPESLTKLRDDGFLKEFDGRSDDCLKKTWPLKH